MQHYVMRAGGNSAAAIARDMAGDFGGHFGKNMKKIPKKFFDPKPFFMSQGRYTGVILVVVEKKYYKYHFGRINYISGVCVVLAPKYIMCYTVQF